MSYRHRLTKPSAVLWMVVGVLQLAGMTAVATVQTVMTILGAVTTVLVGAAGLWLLRGSTGTVGRPVPVRAAVRPVHRSR